MPRVPNFRKQTLICFLKDAAYNRCYQDYAAKCSIADLHINGKLLEIAEQLQRIADATLTSQISQPDLYNPDATRFTNIVVQVKGHILSAGRRQLLPHSLLLLAGACNLLIVTAHTIKRDYTSSVDVVNDLETVLKKVCLDFTIKLKSFADVVGP